ncbi:hypothetical protein KKH15_01205 [Patescibacteria group bacterium]|nr:hypothetical protein [Patescibacteria group bacterium]MBU1754688.1 hypothetical protein [Patescibacteria group bacterium]
MPKRPQLPPTALENIVKWVGSEYSLILHTVVFAGFFVAATASLISFDTMLLFLTTIVSLEAIYLAIFIQMTVNQNTESLREVEEDIEEIGEDIDEIQEDIDELSEEEEEEELRDQQQSRALDQLTKDIHSILADLEALKKGK